MYLPTRVNGIFFKEQFKDNFEKKMILKRCQIVGKKIFRPKTTTSILFQKTEIFVKEIIHYIC